MRTQSGNKQTAWSAGKRKLTESPFFFSFASDWLRGCCDFFGPITEQVSMKPNKSLIIFDTRLEIPLLQLWANNYYISIFFQHMKVLVKYDGWCGTYVPGKGFGLGF